MPRKQDQISADGAVLCILLLLNAIVLEAGYVSHSGWYYSLLITAPLLFISIISILKKSR